MFREKTIIRCRKISDKAPWPWLIKIGKRSIPKKGHGLYRLFSRVCYHLEDRKNIYSIDIIVKRRR